MTKFILVLFLVSFFETANADSLQKCIVKSASTHDSDRADTTYVTFELSCEKNISTGPVFAMSDKTVAILLSAKANKSPIDVRIDTDKFIRFVDFK